MLLQASRPPSRYQLCRPEKSRSQPVRSVISFNEAPLTRGRLISGMMCPSPIDHVVHLDEQRGTLGRVHFGFGGNIDLVVLLVAPAHDVSALPLVGFRRDLARQVLVHEALGVGLRHRGRVHLDVAPELAVGVGVRDIRREKDRCRHRLNFEVDAGLLASLFEDRLLLLPRRVDGRLIDELHLLAVLLADAVSASLPSSGIENLIGSLDVEFELRVRRTESRGRVEKIAGRSPGASVDEVLHALAIGEQRHRPTHLGVAERKVLGLDARAFAVDLVPRIRDAQLHKLDVSAGYDVGAPLAASLHSLQHLILDLQVPRIVVLAGLQDRARRRGGVPAALHFDRIEERAVWHVVVGVDLAAHHVARLEIDELVRPGANRLQVRRGFARLGADVWSEQVLRNDHPFGGDKGRRPKRRRLLERNQDGVRINFGDRHVLVDAARDRCSGRIARVLPGENAIVGREWRAVVPFDALLQPPADDLAAFEDAPVLRRRDVGRQDRYQVAVLVPAGQRLVEDARAFLVLGAIGKMRLQQRRALPPQGLQRAAAAPLGWFVG